MNNKDNPLEVPTGQLFDKKKKVVNEHTVCGSLFQPLSGCSCLTGDTHLSRGTLAGIMSVSTKLISFSQFLGAKMRL